MFSPRVLRTMAWGWHCLHMKNISQSHLPIMKLWPALQHCFWCFNETIEHQQNWWQRCHPNKQEAQESSNWEKEIHCALVHWNLGCNDIEWQGKSPKIIICCCHKILDWRKPVRISSWKCHTFGLQLFIGLLFGGALSIEETSGITIIKKDKVGSPELSFGLWEEGVTHGLSDANFFLVIDPQQFFSKSKEEIMQFVSIHLMMMISLSGYLPHQWQDGKKSSICRGHQELILGVHLCFCDKSSFVVDECDVGHWLLTSTEPKVWSPSSWRSSPLLFVKRLHSFVHGSGLSWLKWCSLEVEGICEPLASSRSRHFPHSVARSAMVNACRHFPQRSMCVISRQN